MNIHELGEALAEMYHNAKGNNKVAMIHLFGIKYAQDISDSGCSKKDIAKAAKIGESYATEISKGVKLAEFVEIKKSTQL
ncbi:MAG: hypothetical protein QNL04_09510 [SAR324 cluster bacterium]|nr:hypothetical protein [SAR324 cluster bacterium]